MTNPRGVITPQYKRDLRSLIRAYRDAESDIITLIRDSLTAGAWGSASHYHAQQQEITRITRELGRILRTPHLMIDPVVEAEIMHSWEQGWRAGGRVFAPVVDQAAVVALVVETKTALRQQHIQVLRSTMDEYRRIVQRVTSSAVATGANHRTVVQDAMRRFADKGITTMVDAGGRRWRIDTYADMAIRSARHNAATEGKIRSFIQHGHELVRISSHPASSPQCAPYQGKILALTGPAGPRMIIGPDGDMETVNVAATWAEAKAHGYKHPNCKHTETAYLSGKNPPPVTESTPEQYEALQRQRDIERNIRRWKRRQLAAVTPAEQAKTRAMVRKWQAAQREHVGAHDFLTRQYDRERA
ncbi:minor capsid protein [Corynebacterium diphtheriae]|nr:minor capsid protein [Corynebacterium diphtheriae]